MSIILSKLFLLILLEKYIIRNETFGFEFRTKTVLKNIWEIFSSLYNYLCVKLWLKTCLGLFLKDFRYRIFLFYIPQCALCTSYQVRSLYIPLLQFSWKRGQKAVRVPNLQNCVSDGLSCYVCFYFSPFFGTICLQLHYFTIMYKVERWQKMQILLLS